VKIVKIENCPKGGRIPEGYCRDSCLNYPGDHCKPKVSSWNNLKKVLKSDGRSWLQIYREDIAGRKKAAFSA
jgi:hypothetical protein